MRVVVLYDPGAEDWTPEDVRGVARAVNQVAQIFGALGHAVRKLPVRHDMRWFQAARRADLAFNLCEGVHGRSEWEEHVVATLEFAGVPVTGAGVWTLAACRRKAMANAILTVENEDQAWARVDEKGRDAARVAVEMANLMEDLS